MIPAEEVASIIQREARLLDDWRLDEWLDLFTEDGIYWIPIDEGADPLLTPSILYDDRMIRKMRVHQLLNEGRIAQSPRSRTMRMLSGVEVEAGGDGEATATCNLLVVELRPGDWRQFGLGAIRLFAGRCEFRLKQVAEQWRIALKKILLLNRTQPIEGLCFIL